MSPALQQATWIGRQASQMPADLPGRDVNWLNVIRDEAKEALTHSPVLNRKQEAWRYTPVASLMDTHFRAAAPTDIPLEQVDLEKHLLPSLETYRMVFLNGIHIPQWGNIGKCAAGTGVCSLRSELMAHPERLSPWLGQGARRDTNPFTALNTLLVNDGLFLSIEADSALDRPIEVIHINSAADEPLMMQPRNLIVLSPGSRATLVERFVGTGNTPYFHNNLTEIVLSERAELRHYRVQHEAPQAFHLSSLYLSQGADSRYEGSTLAFGGAWSRTDCQVGFQGEGADCDLSGLYVVGDKQLADFHLDVRHGVPGCASRERFKGILHGKGRAVFDGRVLVEPQAQRSDAHLTNDNLMLSRDAEVDTKPQLEIHADDVSCSHGTTVGQIEEEQVFYLRSRGIDTDTAQKMLCTGFAGEIIDRIPLAALRQHAYEALTGALFRSVRQQE